MLDEELIEYGQPELPSARTLIEEQAKQPGDRGAAAPPCERL